MSDEARCKYCGKTKAGHVRYSNFRDVPFCGHPEYGLKVFTEPSPAPQAEREWFVADSMPEAMKILADKLAQPVGTAKPESEKEVEL